MDTKRALEIKKALLLIAEVFDSNVRAIASCLAILNLDRYKILVKASDLWNNFDQAGLVERGKMLGVTITEVEY